MDIRSWITHKVRSQRGASLSMALMLMLVCTTVAAIVLAAGTAAAGRYSQLEAMDKSYYNVTSAAKLFKEELGEREPGEPYEVRIQRECSKATKEGDGWTVDPTANWSLRINDKSVPTTTGADGLTVFERMMCDMLFSGDNISGYVQQEKLSRPRYVTMDQIKSSIDTTVPQPMPYGVDFKEQPYDSFTLKAASTEAGVTFSDVVITPKRNSDTTFSFTFTEGTTNENPSPSVFTVFFAVGAPTTQEPPTETAGGGLRWDTTVTWTYLYIIAGAA